MHEIESRMSLLLDQIALVTGASSGIGRAIAIDLTRQGADACLVGRRREALEAAAEEISALGGRSHVYRTDLTCDPELYGLAESIQQHFGRLEILVLCGGAISYGPVSVASVEEFDLQYRSNLRCHYLLVQVLLPLLIKSQGQIVFVNSSTATRVSTDGVGQFTATQYALRAIADSLRSEVNANGVRVLSVYPGRTATPRMAERFEQEGRTYHPELLMQPEDVATMVTHALCLPRTAEVTDIMMRPMMK
jgi:NADP-dependent 3-hydroxy acid dehydrogenase YdfG